MHARIADGLRRVTPEVAAETYAVSLWVYYEDDEPTCPVVVVSVNTESAMRQAATRTADAGEARWNFAFWSQDPLDVMFDSRDDPTGTAVRDQWFAEQGFADAAERDPELAVNGFISLLERTVEALHRDSVVRRSIGRPVPVLIHGLEYEAATAERNLRANPDGLAEPFAAWVMSSYR